MTILKTQHPNIICLQETHLVQDDLNTLIKKCNLDYYIAGTSTNSRGVAILMNNTFKCKVVNCQIDNKGRYITLDLDLDNLLLGLLLLTSMLPTLMIISGITGFLITYLKSRDTSLVTVGDWNTHLTEQDAYNYLSLRHPKCRKIINDFMMKENMTDLWRVSNKLMKGFTSRSQEPCRRYRLDYFHLSEDLLGLDPEVEYLPAYKSDHNPIVLTFFQSRQCRGKGPWKFNNQLLQNQEFKDMVIKI